MRNRSYSELIRHETFEDRFRYLSLKGVVGQATFGFDRWINQQFYQSREWRLVRQEVILRDNGCDMGVPGYEVAAGLIVHHMNPITPEDVEEGFGYILDPEFLIVVSHNTHNAIHYGNESMLPRPPVERERGDTSLWTPMRGRQ